MNYIDDFNQYVKDIQAKHKELCEQLSEIDCEQEDILHFLELATYDAITMMRATKKLKGIRDRRRKIKNEIAMISKVHSRLGNGNLIYAKPSVYEVRTNALSDFMVEKKIKTKKEE
jgi:tagatose-1,6-bisphosphate aldolase